MQLNEKKYPRIAGVNYESMVDGEGVRAVIFLSGCPHGCPGCHNQEAQNPEAGVACDNNMVDEIAGEICKRPFLKGITISGGDPMFSPKQTARFLLTLEDAMLKRDRPMPDVWMYTGYTLEELLRRKSPGTVAALRYVHVLVDGRFEQENADRTLAFRGSSNQKIWEHHDNGQWYDVTAFLDSGGRCDEVNYE